MPKKYANKTERKLSLRDELPEFAQRYISHFINESSENSVFAYTYDLIVFFKYLINNNPSYKEKKTSDFLASDMENLTASDFDEFLAYLRESGNHLAAQKRKLSALQGMFNFMVSRNMISKNPAQKVKLAKNIPDREITYLTDEESAALLNYIKNRPIDEKDPRKKKKENERIRDYAITALLLGTGMRVSEMCGIDRGMIDFESNKVYIYRKGGSHKHVYFSDLVAEALYDYNEQRELIEATDADGKNAFFLSYHKKRITARTVENLISQYATAVVPYKHITPHKLRSSFATSVLHKTKNIAVVSAALNHKNLSTTQKYYAKVLDDDLKEAASNSPI